MHSVPTKNQRSCPCCGKEGLDLARTFLGFAKGACIHCKASIIEPLSNATRVFYYIVTIGVLAFLVGTWGQGQAAWPGGMTLACVWALMKDARIRRQRPTAARAPEIVTAAPASTPVKRAVELGSTDTSTTAPPPLPPINQRELRPPRAAKTLVAIALVTLVLVPAVAWISSSCIDHRSSKAVQLVKDSRLSTSRRAANFGVPNRRTEDRILVAMRKRRGDVEIEGWSSREVTQRLFLVTYGWREKGKRRAYSFEVDVVDCITRSVNDDSELCAKYGIAMPSPPDTPR